MMRISAKGAGLPGAAQLALLLILLVALAWSGCLLIEAAHSGMDRDAAQEFDRDVGITTVPLNGELAEVLGLPADASGLVVTSTAPRRAPEIAPGDLIEAVNGRPVASSLAAGGALRRRGGRLDLLLNRRGKHRHLHFAVARSGDSAKSSPRSGGR